MSRASASPAWWPSSRAARATTGARVAFGECVELGEEELPYAPIVSVLRSLARDGDAVLETLPPGVRAELATLLPELGGGAWPSGSEPLRANETTLGQPRLFEALLTLLDHLGREQPFALVLEDIHWADRSTRAFLVFLGRSLWTERVLVIATYRSDELHRRHPLRPLLAELERDTRARRIELTRLTRDELADLLEDILGGPPDAELVERLYARSEGNPLFTEELLAARLDGRGGLPTTLRDALMVRIERLSEPAQEVLRLLSAARVISHDVLADASGLGGAELRTVVREAAESNVIVADARGRYQFRHALLREVVHDDLLPGEHAELHLALARALEAPGRRDRRGRDHHRRHRPPLPVGRLPARGAASRPCAPPTRRSASTPTARRARCSSARWTCGRACPTRWSRPAATATSWCAAGRARADQRRLPRRAPRRCSARRSARSTSSSSRGWRPGCWSCSSRAQWSLGRAEEARAAVARAVDLLPEDEAQSPERARIFSRQAKIAMLQGRFSEVLPAARAALAAASEADAGPARRRAQRDGPLARPARRGRGGQRDPARGDRRSRPIGFERTSAWSNLADALHLVGRSREALRRRRAGPGRRARRGPRAATG